jgi:hypothetical protein
MNSYTNETKSDRQKQSWIRPQLEMVDVAAAEGSLAGPLCDKHGSVSQGSNCR